ncbi:hypothetical protein Tco_0279753, partial [Tanacetum coccineum]
TSIANDVSALVVDYMRMENTECMPLESKVNTRCVRENAECLKLEADISNFKKLLSESEQRCSQLEQHAVNLEVKFQKYMECFENPNVCDNSQSPAYNAFFEINILKEQLQGRDTIIKHLQAQLKNVPLVQVGPTVGDCDKQALETEITQLKDRITSLHIQLNAYKIDNKSLSKRYEELAKSNMFSRAELTGRITALTSENTNLKAGIK